MIMIVELSMQLQEGQLLQIWLILLFSEAHTMLYDDAYYMARDMFQEREMELPGGCKQRPLWNEQFVSPMQRMQHEIVVRDPYLRAQVDPKPAKPFFEVIAPPVKIEMVLPLTRIPEYVPPIRNDPLLLSSSIKSSYNNELLGYKKRWFNPVTGRYED
jgi:hypothetical protein